ncbi:hypothetical protein Bca4012_037652 [Brassica carinata]
MTRDIEEELSESDEEEPSDEITLEERCEAEDTEENQNQKGESSELASVWNGPVTRARLRAQEKSLQDLIKIVGLGPKEDVQDKPACWFNLIVM